MLFDHRFVFKKKPNKVFRQKPSEEIQLANRRHSFFFAKQNYLNSASARKRVEVFFVMGGKVLVIILAQVPRETFGLNGDTKRLCEIRYKPVDDTQ